MNIDSAFPSKWLRAADLKKRDFTLQMLRVLEEEIKGDGSTQPVLYFHGAQKGLVLNKTNANTISDAYGEETDNWIGHEITLHPTRTDFKGERVDCIRIRDIQVPAPPAPVADEQPADVAADDGSIPF